MYKIEAIIRYEKLQEMKKTLEKEGFYGMTVMEVRGRGRQKGIRLQGRAGEYTVDLIDKIKLELIVRKEEVDRLIDIICETANTGKVGDGKIFILPVKDIVRIRTREHGMDAI